LVNLACLISHSKNELKRTHTYTHTGFGGGGGGGGVYEHEATIVNYDDSMTINVNGGDRGAGDSDSSYAGFAGSDGKVFLVSGLIVLLNCRRLINNTLHLACFFHLLHLLATG